MLYLIKFFYQTFLLPPGIFIILFLFLSIGLYRRGTKGVRLLVLITFCLYAFSTPFVGNLLIRSLESQHSPPSSLTGDVIVVLGGGATLDTPDINGLGHLSGSAANRLLTTARLQKKTRLPVIFSGGQVYSNSGNEAQVAKRILNDLEVPDSKIILEDSSRNTMENAANTSRVMKSLGYDKPILITSAFHMERSVLDFERFNLEVIPYPTDYMANVEPDIHYNLFIPSSLEETRIALKEYLGIAAVRWLPDSFGY